MTNPNKRIEELIEIAKAASPGPWDVVCLEDGSYFCPPFWGVRQVQKTINQDDANHKFVEKLNPAFVLKLLESWKQMRKVLQGFSGRDGYDIVNGCIAKADKVFE